MRPPLAVLALALPLALFPQAGAAEPLSPDAAARAVVDRWLAAQNHGAFSDYQALYAQPFVGVRRTGARVVRMDSAAWMKDRGRMFQRPMQVAIADLRLTTTAGGVVAHFTQTWAQGTYKDSGPKELVLIRDRDGVLRITREEMLESRVEPVKVSVSDLHLPLLPEGAVLQEGAPAAWGRGEPQLTSGRPYFDGDLQLVRARRAVDSARLPEAYQALVGKPLQLLGSTGPVCTARVKGFTLATRLRPNPMMYEAWAGTWAGHDEKKRRRSNAEIAREVWDTTQRHHLLVAELDAAGAPCGKLGTAGGATWARLASAPAVKVLPARPDPAWTQVALLRTRQLPAYAKLQQEHLAQTKEDEEAPSAPGPWEEHHGEPQVRVMERGDGTRLISVSMATGCPFFHELWAIWDVKGSGPGAEFRLLMSTEDYADVPESAADVDGDGREELILPNGILRRPGGRLGERRRLEIPDFACSCGSGPGPRG